MANVDLSHCPNSGFFEIMDSRCHDCTKRYECDWLNSTDEFNELDTKPMDFLYRALTFGIDYIDAFNFPADHDAENCGCDSCKWLRHARGLVREHYNSVTQIPAAHFPERQP
jgi:hypothetical protein